MKKKKGSLLIGLGLILIAAAALLCAYNVYDGHRAGQASDQTVRFLENMLLPVGGQNGATDTATDERPALPSDVSLDIIVEDVNDSAALPSDGLPAMDVPFDTPVDIEIPDYVLNPHMEMPVSHYDGQDYIGILEIPAIDLKLPVISRWNYPRLRIAPCRYAGSAYAKNLVISAHNYPSHFGRLSKLYEGVAVRFTDVDGNVFDYRVELKETLNPGDVEYMKDGGWDLTLFTCTPGGSYRITLRCELVKELYRDRQFVD